MTFEYRLPLDLESMTAMGDRSDTLPEFQFLIQESQLIQNHTVSWLQNQGEIWHYRLSDRGYTWLSLQQEPDIIAVLQWWDREMESRIGPKND